MEGLTRECLERVFIVDPDRGTFRWKNSAGRHGRIEAGTLAGLTNKEGYRYLRIGRVVYKASRLMWFYVHGEWPAGQIDHKNRDRADDRISNLRNCTQSENKSNSGVYKNNTSGYKGVIHDQRRGKWRAVVMKDGVLHHCGWYTSKDDAIQARQIAERDLHGDFASGALCKENG
jgi:hypothetical protein